MNDKNELNEGFNEDESADSEQYLTFLINEQEYAVDILKIQGIQGWVSCTPLPNTPDHILGVINLRGAIVPIVDLRIRFNTPQVEYNELTVVVVVKVIHGDSEKVVGLVVDAVSEVYNITQKQLNAPPEFGENIDIAYVQDLAMVNDNLVIILNVDKLIGDSVLASLDVSSVA